MQSLAEITKNLTTAPSNSVSKPSESSGWKITVSDFVSQCWKTYPKFGDEDLKSKIKSFIVGLEDYPEDVIAYGFKHWLKRENKMPMPSDIGNVCRGKMKDVLEAQRFKSQVQLQIESRNEGSDWNELSKEEQEVINQRLQHVKSMRSEKEKMDIPVTDYWSRMTDGQKRASREEFISAHQRLRGETQ